MDKITTVLFDLDGPLVETKQFHFEAFNLALKQCGFEELSYERHLKEFDGLSTKQKLEKLNITGAAIQAVWMFKQDRTDQLIKNTIKRDESLVKLFLSLRDRGYKLGVCTNSITKTTINIISALGIYNLCDVILSNGTVERPKPHPEIYWQAMIELNSLPKETLIIEDSPIGISAAQDSGANLMIVKRRNEVTFENILNKIEKIENRGEVKTGIYENNNLNILIPMAGEGSRFKEAGFTFPKPLISINKLGGNPMIKCVVDSLKIKANYIFIVKKEHIEKYNLITVLNLIAPNCSIMEVNKTTEGAACTALLAKDLINNDKELLIANADQFIEWNPIEFFYKMGMKNADGGILTFKNSHPKWSYAKINEYNEVLEVAEGTPISNQATAGIYYWSKGCDFVNSAEEMIRLNKKVKKNQNYEFYLAPSINGLIEKNKKILSYDIGVENFYSLGTPEDLNYFENNYKR